MAVAPRSLQRVTSGHQGRNNTTSGEGLWLHYPTQERAHLCLLCSQSDGGWLSRLGCHNEAPRTGAYTVEICSPTILEAVSLRTRCWWGWLLLKPLSLVCRWPSLPRVLTWSSSCVFLCPHLLSLKDTSPIGLGLIHLTSLYLKYLNKDPVPKYSHHLRSSR